MNNYKNIDELSKKIFNLTKMINNYELDTFNYMNIEYFDGKLEYNLIEINNYNYFQIVANNTVIYKSNDKYHINDNDYEEIYYCEFCVLFYGYLDKIENCNCFVQNFNSSLQKKELIETLNQATTQKEIKPSNRIRM